MKKDSRQKNNKGFSLIEVLVAMTILAIIVTPLLHVFVTAAYTNAKAKQILRATTAAQNTLENLKAVSAGDLARTVYGYSEDEKGNAVNASFPITSFTSSDGNTYSVFEAAASGTQWREAAVPCVTAVSGSTTAAEFVGGSAANGEIVYVLPNVGLDNSKYDMVLKLEPNKTGDAVSIMSMQQKNSVYFVQSQTQAGDIAAGFETDNRSYVYANPGARSVSASDFAREMTRTITVTIAQSGSGASVRLEYTYDCGSANVTDQRTTTEMEIAVNDTETNAVFVYYYPLYGNAFARDSFVIENTDNLDCTVYLIAMQGSDYNSFNEAQYKANLRVAETYVATEYTGTDARTTMHTKLLSNVAASKFTLSNGGSIPVQPSVDTLGNREERVYEYSVTVTVYKHNESSFTTDTGVKIFEAQESDRLTQFTGSMLNGGK